MKLSKFDISKCPYEIILIKSRSDSSVNQFSRWWIKFRPIDDLVHVLECMDPRRTLKLSNTSHEIEKNVRLISDNHWVVINIIFRLWSIFEHDQSGKFSRLLILHYDLVSINLKTDIDMMILHLHNEIPNWRTSRYHNFRIEWPSDLVWSFV